MKQLIPFLLISTFIISCSTNSNPDSYESVWEVTSETTAQWMGNEISVTGLFSDSFVKDSTSIRIETYPDIKRVVISVIYGEISRTSVTIVEKLEMYSRPLNTDLLALDKRELACQGNACEDAFSLDLPIGSVIMNGDVKCGESALDLDEFVIIYEDSEKLFSQITFESYGIEETIEQLTCS